MSHRSARKTKKNLIKQALGYGIHIWSIFFLANVITWYSFTLYLQAASPQSPPVQLADTDIPIEEEELPTPTPTLEPTPGPHINLAFSIPGIGSGGGTMKPLHPKREVIIYLYPPDLNPRDGKVQPQYEVKGYVSLDTDKSSPTYTSFINKDIDLGYEVKNDKYQIMYKTPYTLPIVVKNKESDVSGKVYPLTPYGDPVDLKHQTMIVGDIYPAEGDWVMDINDYNVLVNCFGVKQKTSECKDKFAPDLNDDGVVDGLDYNVMVKSFKKLVQMGIPAPSLPPQPGQQVSRLSYLNLTPTSTVKKKPTPIKSKPTPTTAAKEVKNETKVSGNSSSTAVLIFVSLLTIAVGIGILKRKQLLALLRRNELKPPPSNFSSGKAGSGSSESNATEAPTTPAEQTQTPTDIAASTEIDPATLGNPSTSSGQDATNTNSGLAADTADIAASTEIDPASLSKQAEPQAPAPTTPAPAQEQPIDADYYVKKQAADDSNQGFWLTLTDDNGPTLAHYTGTQLNEGFAHIKGVLKKEGAKEFVEISELTPSA